MGIWDIFAYCCNSVKFLGFILFKKWSNLSPSKKLHACHWHHDICRFTIQYLLTLIVKGVVVCCKGRALSKEWFLIFSDVWTSKTAVGIPRYTVSVSHNAGQIIKNGLWKIWYGLQLQNCALKRWPFCDKYCFILSTCSIVTIRFCCECNFVTFLRWKRGTNVNVAFVLSCGWTKIQLWELLLSPSVCFASLTSHCHFQCILMCFIYCRSTVDIVWIIDKIVRKQVICVFDWLTICPFMKEYMPWKGKEGCSYRMKYTLEIKKKIIFTKLWKVGVSFVMSAQHLGTAQLLMDAFAWNLCVCVCVWGWGLLNSIKRIQVWLTLK